METKRHICFSLRLFCYLVVKWPFLEVLRGFEGVAVFKGGHKSLTLLSSRDGCLCPLPLNMGKFMTDLTKRVQRSDLCALQSRVIKRPHRFRLSHWDTRWPLRLSWGRSSWQSKLSLAFQSFLWSPQTCEWRGLGSYRWALPPADLCRWNNQALLKILTHKIRRYSEKSYCFKS